MNLLAEISESDFESGAQSGFEKTRPYHIRRTARAVVVNSEGKIAIQHISKYDYYKLPGGGVEEGETLEEALKREMKEEAGCNIDIIQELGVVIEYREQPGHEQGLLQISFGYLVKPAGEIREPQLEEAEVAEGLRPLLVSYEQALKNIKESKITHQYEAKFIVKRELEFLKAAERFLQAGI